MVQPAQDLQHARAHEARGHAALETTLETLLEVLVEGRGRVRVRVRGRVRVRVTCTSCNTSSVGAEGAADSLTW